MTVIGKANTAVSGNGCELGIVMVTNKRNCKCFFTSSKVAVNKCGVEILI
jgi:hypothetical protein